MTSYDKAVDEILRDHPGVTRDLIHECIPVNLRTRPGNFWEVLDQAKAEFAQKTGIELRYDYFDLGDFPESGLRPYVIYLHEDSFRSIKEFDSLQELRDYLVVEYNDDDNSPEIGVITNFAELQKVIDVLNEWEQSTGFPCRWEVKEIILEKPCEEP